MDEKDEKKEEEEEETEEEGDPDLERPAYNPYHQYW